jgi:carboxymethylenebutenolidase
MATVSFLASDPSVNPNNIAVVGFCFGGGMAWRLVTKDSRIKAAVPFYGVNPNLKYVPKIEAAVLAIYGELDERINAGIDDITQAMENANKTFKKIIYPGAQHAFHNDANPDRYHPQAARQAWQETLDWLRQWMPN